MATMYGTRPAAVSVDGPYSAQDRYGDEYPQWCICLVDSDGEPIGKVYRCNNREQAISLGQRMARDRRLPFDNEAGYA